MIKLIATDMDGTLLNSKGHLPKNFDTVFKKLQEKNILFAVASGRQYFTLVELFKEYADQMLFLAENGTYVAYHGKEVAVHALDKKIAHQMIQKARKANLDIILAMSHGAYLETENPEVLKEVSKYFVKNTVVDDLLEVEGDILKVTIYNPNGVEQHSYHHFKEFEEIAEVCIAGHVWIDMMAKGVSKGMAIRDVQKTFGITYQETMVFGDYLNDLEMLKNAHYSYAMANAHPLLKEVANFIAKSNDEEGVLEAIKENNVLDEIKHVG